MNRFCKESQLVYELITHSSLYMNLLVATKRRHSFEELPHVVVI